MEPSSPSLGKSSSSSSSSSSIRESSSSLPTAKTEPNTKRQFPATRSLPFILGITPEYDKVRTQFHADFVEWRQLRISLETEIQISLHTEGNSGSVRSVMSLSSSVQILSLNESSAPNTAPSTPPEYVVVDATVRRTPPVAIGKNDRNRSYSPQRSNTQPNSYSSYASGHVSGSHGPQGSDLLRAVSRREFSSAMQGDSLGSSPASLQSSRASSFSGRRTVGFEFRKAGRGASVSKTTSTTEVISEDNIETVTKPEMPASS
eukprot:TRINITY_DN2711_c0_g1_i4.p1 TRINITY_DN2711_c0_g1~~TRINITY_DN2711_c0_g1_i4.p1  ORF type:complete len:261 (+),score=58.53 TRINITY_DN2711_c0_g1_i4:584-1366(+)